MKRDRASLMLFCMALVLLILPATGPYARGQGVFFPQYGSGPVEVRIYSDYFCPPCRSMKPQMDPVLQDLLKRDIITLIWVDTPFYRHSALYARFLLYALMAKSDSDHASFVRNVLNEAASGRQVTTEAHIEALFKSKGIPYTTIEVGPVFERYNALIKEDQINATPTCVMIKAGKKEKIIGGPEIIAALKRL